MDVSGADDDEGDVEALLVVFDGPFVLVAVVVIVADDKDADVGAAVVKDEA